LFSIILSGMADRSIAARPLVAAAVLAASMLVLAGGCSSGASSSRGRQPTGPTAGVAEADCQHFLTSLACYTPRQIRVAYGIQPLLDRGIDGRGQTVLLMDFANTPLPPPQPVQQTVPQQSGSQQAAPQPASQQPVQQQAAPGQSGSQQPVSPVTDIRQDLALFDAVFGLPAARLQVDTGLAGADWPWLAGGEEVEDAEIVHAIAPAAAIRVVLIPRRFTPASWLASVEDVLKLARSQGSVVSISGILGEDCFTPAEVAGLNSALQADEDQRVTVVASSGDYGAASTTCSDAITPAPVKDVGLPASDPLVLAAGGTTLDADRATGAYLSETAWRTPPGTANPQTSSGGFSHLFTRPAYQDGVPGIGAGRGLPDVAADAATRTGMTLAVTGGSGNDAFYPATGTSAAAPLWAGLIALANQYAGRDLGFVNPAIYRIGRSASYHRAFHDVSTGNDTMTISGQTITGYQASPGWDPVTGWGSPNAQALIPLLVRYTSP
jgi:subtilase family serine protease